MDESPNTVSDSQLEELGIIIRESLDWFIKKFFQFIHERKIYEKILSADFISKYIL